MFLYWKNITKADKLNSPSDLTSVSPQNIGNN